MIMNMDMMENMLKKMALEKMMGKKEEFRDEKKAPALKEKRVKEKIGHVKSAAKGGGIKKVGVYGYGRTNCNKKVMWRKNKVGDGKKLVIYKSAIIFNIYLTRIIYIIRNHPNFVNTKCF